MKDIKSVNIRSTNVKRRLLMSSSSVKIFQAFLKERIDSEVLVINTNLGMEVYYYSNEDYSDFIKESVLLYVIKHTDGNRLEFKNCVNRDEVGRNFSEAMFTFVKYPQLFLAYAKKFIYVKEQNVDSQYILPILNVFFEEGLRLLTEKGKVPYYGKIQTAKSKSQKLEDGDIIKKLISEILLKEHSN